MLLAINSLRKSYFNSSVVFTRTKNSFSVPCLSLKYIVLDIIMSFALCSFHCTSLSLPLAVVTFISLVDSVLMANELNIQSKHVKKHFFSIPSYFFLVELYTPEV